MKHLIFLGFFSLFFITCKKKEKVVNEVFDTTGAVLVSQTYFTSNVHTTSGCVRLYTKSGSKYVVFEGFKTDKGPDLRVYLSKSIDNVSFIDIGKLKSISGTFYYNIDSSINTNENKYVLIWCEDVSVLFGNALMQ